MKIGSLVRNKSSLSLGIVVKVYAKKENVIIHWIKSGYNRTWSRYSHNLEVVCE